MTRKIIFWVLAFLITAGSAVFQRMTGPSYPKKGEDTFEGKQIKYTLERSHVSSSNYLIEIETGDESIKGAIYWREYKSNGEFNVVEMVGGKVLKGELPARKPLEKLEYFVKLHKGENSIDLGGDRVTVIRFKGDVPNIILIPHIIAMFLSMLLATRTGLEIFNKEPKYVNLTIWTLVILFIGGFPLGFAMNWYAFGEMWGGIPFGNDITDNKTLIAFVGWLVAFWMIKKNQLPKLFVILAAILMLLVYMIPHSV